MKKMVKVKKKPRGFSKTPRVFLAPARGFSPTFSNGGKNPQDFFKK